RFAAIFLILFISLPLQRRNEFAADAWMLRATGDLDACESMLEKVHEGQDPNTDSKWASHPNLQSRLAALRKLDATAL
ncbi:hypothetical protein EON81_09235, partial [bacterium]